MNLKILSSLSPGMIVIFSLILTIIAGTAALSLPWAHTVPISFIDLLFTATSATCVTGLLTIPLDSFTTYGQGIILILIQIGGLGLITLTLFIISFFVEFGFATQLMAGELLETHTWKNIRKVIFSAMGITIIMEFIGVLCIFPSIYSHYPYPAYALFLSMFQSIASFCNAGMSLLPYKIAFYHSHSLILLITTFLMIFGGLGFITWTEIVAYLAAYRQKKRYTFSLHSKIVFYGTSILILAATVLILLLEYKHAFASLSFPHTIVNALFHSVSFRTGGEHTLPLHAFTLPTLYLVTLLAFIGASPGSTGSGVKITAITIFFATLKSVILGKTSVNIKGRRIPRDQVFKSMAIITLSLLWNIVMLFLLLLTEHDFSFFQLFFETISAFATLGLTYGVTPYLSMSGKVLIMLTMFIGRVGSLTLILLLKELTVYSKKSALPIVTYPEERVMLG
ncbi:MAG: potassium transporter TrkG [Candidatus Babeliales bacterium]